MRSCVAEFVLNSDSIWDAFTIQLIAIVHSTCFHSHEFAFEDFFFLYLKTKSFNCTAPMCPIRFMFHRIQKLLMKEHRNKKHNYVKGIKITHRIDVESYSHCLNDCCTVAFQYISGNFVLGYFFALFFALLAAVVNLGE